MTKRQPRPLRESAKKTARKLGERAALERDDDMLWLMAEVVDKIDIMILRDARDEIDRKLEERGALT